MTSAAPAPPPDYLALGHLSLDHTLHLSSSSVAGAADAPPALGGTAAYATLTAGALGRRPAIVTSAAADVDLSPLAGVQLHVIPSAQSTTFHNEIDGARRLQTLRACAGGIVEGSIPSAWKTASIIHLAPIAGELAPGLASGFGRECFIGVTPQGWMRQWDAEGRIRPAPWDSAQEALDAADAVVMSLEDLGGDEATVEAIAAATRLLALTEGPAGARVYWNGDVRRIPAPPAPQVDPTGAGDVFAAAFFIRLYDTRDPWEAARFANQLASISVTRPGLRGVPTPEEALQASMVVIR
ncbi:MAG TPA: PfkB family carbohydrate kinase [Anaerolineales bacterium]|nr:PfkB family carbohydrate kinase [Anaerolineales bacterium]